MSVKTWFAAAAASFPLLVYGATPTIVSESTTANDTDSTTQVANLPSSLVNGNLVYCAFGIDAGAATSATWPGTWTENFDAGSTSVFVTGGYRRIDGSEGSTVSITTTASEKSVAHCWQINGDDTGNPPEAGTVATGTNTNPNPPNLAPTGGSKTSYLFFAFTSIQNGTNTCSGFPSGYTNTGQNSGSAVATQSPICWGQKAVTGSSDDPGTFTITSGNWAAETFAIYPSTASPPSFAVAPSCSPTTNGVSCTYTASAASTAYCVGVALADGTPTANQIIAGTNDGGTAALATGSDANSGTSDTIVCTGTNTPPKLNYHVVLTNGGGNSSVDSSQTGKLRSPRSGYAIVEAASIFAGGMFDRDSDFNPDQTVADLIEHKTSANESANCFITIGTDGKLRYFDHTDGSTAPEGADSTDAGNDGIADCAGRITFPLSYELHSSATDGRYTAPTKGTFAQDDTAFINNAGPTCEPQVAQLVHKEDVAMDVINLPVFGDCRDDDGDQLEFSVSSGTLPNGTSLGGTGNEDWSGTPDTENEAGEALEFTGCDPADECAAFSIDDFVINTWTVPNLATLNASDAAAAICVAAHWRCDQVGLSIGGLTCDLGTAGLVLTQDPAAAAEAEALEDIAITLARLCASTKPKKLDLGLGLNQ